MKIQTALIAIAALVAPLARADDATPPADTPAAPKVHYKKSKKLDFSKQTVEGKLRRPETSLITASEGLGTNGILRLRENFLDKFAADAGEAIK